MANLLAILKKISDVISNIVEILCAVFVGIIAIVLFVNVVGRFVFSYSFNWSEELSRYLIIWVSMLITSTLVKNDELIKVDFFDTFWPPKLIKYRAYVYRVLMYALFFVLIKHGWAMALSGKMMTLFTLKISWFWPYLAIPVGSVLILFQLTVVTLLEINGSLKKDGASR